MMALRRLMMTSREWETPSNTTTTPLLPPPPPRDPKLLNEKPQDEDFKCSVGGEIKSARHLHANTKATMKNIIPDKFATMKGKACMFATTKKSKMVPHHTDKDQVAPLDCVKNKQVCVRKIKEATGESAVIFPLCVTDRGGAVKSDEGFWVYAGETPPSLLEDAQEYPAGNSRKAPLPKR
jgi:hypothetical protein